MGAAMLAVSSGMRAQEAPSSTAPPAPIVRSAPTPDVQPDQPSVAPPAPAPYNPAIFLKPLPAAQLAFVRQFDGQWSAALYNDRQFHKLLKSAIPDCMFHYGRDMPLDQALDITLSDSRVPVIVHDGRYVLLTGHQGPYLDGRSFLWIDLQEGLVLGGFFFRPTNGEPSPALNIFSRQIREDALGLTELPPEFDEALQGWMNVSHIPPVTARYFINGNNKKILLEHDEDLCAGGNAPFSADECNQMAEDAADIDLNAADYVESTHHATNATAWMLSGEQVAWIQVRNRTCGGLADPIGCRVRMTRERVHVISRPRVPRK